MDVMLRRSSDTQKKSEVDSEVSSLNSNMSASSPLPINAKALINVPMVSLLPPERSESTEPDITTAHPSTDVSSSPNRRATLERLQVMTQLFTTHTDNNKPTVNQGRATDTAAFSSAPRKNN